MKMSKKSKALATTTKAIDVLTPRQRRFVFEYVQGGIAYKAYMKAYGCDELKAMAASSLLLRKIKILEAISQVKEDDGYTIQQKFRIKRDGLLAMLVEQLEQTPDDYVDIKDGRATLKSGKSMKSLRSFSYSESTGEKGNSSAFSFTMHDKLKAIELLAKMIGAIDADTGDDKRDIGSLRERASDIIAKYRKL